MTSNYKEIVLFHEAKTFPDGWMDVQTNLPEDTFNKLMNAFAAKRKFRFFDREFKSYKRGDIVCENYNNKDIRLIQHKFLDAVIDDEKKMLTVHYEHNKLPFHIFPSTMQLHDIGYVRRATAKVHNRIALHFETSFNPHVEEDVKRRVWISCHTSGNVDTENLDYVLNGVVTDVHHAITH